MGAGRQRARTSAFPDSHLKKKEGRPFLPPQDFARGGAPAPHLRCFAQLFSLPARFQDTNSPIVDPPVLEAGCLYASTSVRDASSPTARMLRPTFFSSWFILMILKSCSWPGSR